MKRLLKSIVAGTAVSTLALPIVYLAAPAAPAGASTVGATGYSLSGGRGSSGNARMQYTVVGQATPDECWNGIGTDTPITYNAAGTITCGTGQAKVNQAYVWGLTQTANDLVWFGTVANTQCLVMGGYLQVTTPMVNETSVCEFGTSPYSPPLPAAAGDWRAPQLFVYSTTGTGPPVNLVTTLPDGTPRATATGKGAQIAGMLGTTLGIRSAGTVPFGTGQIVFFAGPSLSLAGGINMFAFREDGSFIGGTTLLTYNDIRKWVTVGTDVFTGVGTNSATGAVLKWDPPETAGAPAATYFKFTAVATIPGDVAELTVATSQLVAGTWPSFAAVGTTMASVYVSPATTPISQLTTAVAWTKVWQASDYEPDTVTAYTYGTGAMAYYDGYVYWGTMHVPGMAFEAAEQYHPSSTSAAGLADFLGSYRAISVFRMPLSDGTHGPVQLLYGTAQLPAYTTGTGSWTLVDNNMGGVSGLYGTSGLGNPFNNYEWSMAVYNDQLYVGTMDWSYLASQTWPAIVTQLGLPAGTPDPIAAIATYGADLFRFPSTRKAAQTLFTDGVGNYLNYGVRNMIATTSGLFLGMADPENLATAPTAKQGGWELIDLTTAQKPGRGKKH